MEICGASATQYGESEQCILSFSPKNGDRTFRDSGDEKSTDDMHGIMVFITVYSRISLHKIAVRYAILNKFHLIKTHYIVMSQHISTLI
jgi:hypothetical protein